MVIAESEESIDARGGIGILTGVILFCWHCICISNSLLSFLKNVSFRMIHVFKIKIELNF